MSQRNVEIVIGRLATDEELRARFHEAPEQTLRELAAQGLELTATEVASMLSCGKRCIEALARELDPRLEKASLRPLKRKGGRRP